MREGIPILDTHAWIWWMLGDSLLKAEDRAALDGLPPSGRPFLCTISLWEVSMLVDLRRLKLELSFNEWLAAAAHPRTVRLLPITAKVACELCCLPASFHRDPADRLIVSSSRVQNLAVLSYDERIKESGLVRMW